MSNSASTRPRVRAVPWYKSKRVLLNTAILGGALATQLSGVALDPALAATIAAVANLAVGMMTKGPMTATQSEANDINDTHAIVQQLKEDGMEILPTDPSNPRMTTFRKQ